MVRRMTAADTDAVVKIWLEASIIAHDFVPAEFWIQRVDQLRDCYLSAAKTYVCEEGGAVVGFLSLLDSTLAALFVLPESQGGGIGSQLLEYVQDAGSELSLTVYKLNHHSIAFYERHGFSVQREQLNPHTGQPELLMLWRQGAN